jgi:hypothetical protein
VAFGLQVRVKQKINRKIKRKERKFDEIEAQYTTERRSSRRRPLDSRLGLN